MAVVPQIWSSRNGCGHVVSSVRATALSLASRISPFSLDGLDELATRAARSSSAECSKSHRKPMDSTSCPTYCLSCPAKTLGSLSLKKDRSNNQTFQSGLSETDLITPNAASVITPMCLPIPFPHFSTAPLMDSLTH